MHSQFLLIVYIYITRLWTDIIGRQGPAMKATIISIFVNCLHHCASSRYLQHHNLRYLADQSR